jgi:hypothetical protein
LSGYSTKQLGEKPAGSPSLDEDNMEFSDGKQKVPFGFTEPSSSQ